MTPDAMCRYVRADCDGQNADVALYQFMLKTTADVYRQQLMFRDDI